MKILTSGERPDTPLDEHLKQDHLISEKAHFRTLCEIMTESHLHFEDQVKQALQEGRVMLGLVGYCQQDS